jgi:hypothetical protein
MLKIFIAIALTLSMLPAVAQQQFPQYAPWMLPHTPGFNQQLLAPTNVTANFQMTATAPVLRVSCANCILSLPPCAAGQTFLLIPAYPVNPPPASTAGPTIQPASADTWTINSNGSQPGSNFSRSVPPFQPSQVLGIGTPAGCEWALTGL